VSEPTDAEVWAVACRVCTPAELRAYELERSGLSQRTMATVLGISRSALRERLGNAARKIAAAMDEAE
jgi:predicted DNA-binding protein (UPF0251 family)